ncbi:MAG: hypothetical protein VW547_07395, partial [Alphaproteobacteria bacterium]
LIRIVFAHLQIHVANYGICSTVPLENNVRPAHKRRVRGENLAGGRQHHQSARRHGDASDDGSSGRNHE